MPHVLKTLRRTFGFLRKTTHAARSRAALHDFWRNPDEENLPGSYLEGSVRSGLLVALVRKHLASESLDAKVLEIGCNVGRNLNQFWEEGFRNLSGVEINSNAIKLLKQRFPALGASANLYEGPVEEAIKTYRDGQFDVAYTMAVLEHIHHDSDWIFSEIARVTNNLLVTVEDESGVSWRHFPRRYDRVFEPLGLKEIESFECLDIEGLGPGFFARVFRKGS